MPRKKKEPSILQRENSYYEYLFELYRGIPSNKLKLVDGLIREAARLKVSLDDLWKDIAENGNTELNARGQEVERTNSMIFTTRDKSYRATIKHLDALLPGKAESKGFSKLLDDDDEDEDG